MTVNRILSVNKSHETAIPDASRSSIFPINELQTLNFSKPEKGFAGFLFFKYPIIKLGEKECSVDFCWFTTNAAARRVNDNTSTFSNGPLGILIVLMAKVNKYCHKYKSMYNLPQTGKNCMDYPFHLA